MLKHLTLLLLIPVFAFAATAQETTARQKELIDASLQKFQQGKIDEAIALNKEAVDLIRNSADAKSEKMITALVNAAFMKKAKIEAAEASSREKFPKDRDVFKPLKELAADGESNLREALEIAQSTGKQETPLGAAVMRNLALMLRKNFPPQEIEISRKRIDEAERLLATAVAVQEKTLGATDAKTLQTQFDFISLYETFRNYPKFFPLMSAYLAAAEKRYGRNGKELLPALRLYASNLYFLKRDDELAEITNRIKEIEPQSKELFPIKSVAMNFESGTFKPPRIPVKYLTSDRMEINEEVLIEADENGRVTRAEANKNLPPELRRLFEDAARASKFKPLVVEGKPAGFRGNLPFKYTATRQPF